MNGLIAKAIAWLMSYNTLPTATEQIDGVLAGFTSMVEKLDAALAQTDDELDASYERQDDAYDAFVRVREQEQSVRETVFAARSKGFTARNNIAALLGGAE